MASCTTCSVLSLVGFQKRGRGKPRPQGNDGILHINFDIPDTASSYLLLIQIILQLTDNCLCNPLVFDNRECYFKPYGA
jgi:hypothetical protein